MPHYLFLTPTLLAACLVGFPDDPKELPREAHRRVAEADVAQLQKHIATCAADAKEARRSGPTAKALAVMVAGHAEALHNDALRSQAVKVARAIENKDWKAAGEAAALLGKAKADPEVLKGPVPKLTLEEAFSPFRSAAVGGMNIEKDIRDFMNGKTPIDAAAVELLALRTLALTRHISAEPAKDYAEGRIGQRDWTRGTREMGDASRELAIEAGKGEKSDPVELMTLLRKLRCSCTNCHFQGRD